MSAAPPLPPPGPPRGVIMNGYPNGAHGRQGSDGSGPAPVASPSSAEIYRKASKKVEEMKGYGVKTLLDHGKAHWAQAKRMVDNRSGLAAAYWEYLVAFQIFVVAIPNHQDFIDQVQTSRAHTHHDYFQIVRDIRSHDERFNRIKTLIENENKRNGTPQSALPPQSSSRPSSAASQYAPVQQHARRPSSSASYRRDDELMLPDAPTSAPLGRAAPAVAPSPPRKKPEVQPKPQSLHGRALHQNAAGVNGNANVSDLAQRLANLRGPTIDTNHTASSQGSSVNMPSPSDYASSSRPLGPRDMTPQPMPTMQLPKLPLDTQLAASMPKAPSPTYSPARNMSLPASINAPRSSARSIVGTGGRNNSLQASSVSSAAPNIDGETGSYFPAQPPRSQPPPARRKSSVHKPAEEQITAEKLYDYIRMYNVLLIDVRSREEFDSGHIFVRAIMCIEPTALQEGDSAVQLQDRLVLSPDEEQAMYERRNEFDLVVYYDEGTKSSSFLRNPNRTEREIALKRLYDTLHEFNEERPLQRPPIFLKGGIDAWTELVGPPALKMTTTAALVANGQTRPGRAIRRSAAPVTQTAKINLQRRRLREYTPMDLEEQQQWLEEARKGRATFEEPLEPDEYDEDATTPVYRTTEDFLRRYPDVEADQQSMMYPPSRPPPPPPYAAPPIPAAPSRPAPSVPRVSYSGVHERQMTPQGRGAQPPVYVAPSRYLQLRLHHTGLINFGVTCYMNSVVQCLAANAGLSGIFLSNRYKEDLQRDNWKGTKGILPEAYATLISNLYKGDISAVRPSTFRKVCAHFNSQWGIDQQQDAKEFLEFVLDHLHEDLNTTWNRTPLKQLTDEQEIQREKLPRPYVARIEWNRYQHRESSVIGNLFAGQHASRLTCTTCGTTSTTYEAFWSISVEIPRDRPADLRDCLRSYCSNERLSGDEVWRCPRCKRDREATKKITITRAPDTLVIHFKRFSASHHERAHKVRTPINFPLQGLDLSPFMEPPLPPTAESQILETAKDGAAQLVALRTDPAMNGPYIYNASAVIWHIGSTLSSGHYVAHVKDKSRGCWRHFNDERFTDFEPGGLREENRLQNEKAYIVFYERERVAGGML